MEDRGSSAISTDEQVVRGANGWVMLAVLLVALALAVPLAVVPGGGIKFVAGVLLFAVSAFSLKGLFTLEPNQAAVMIFFGSYAGTVRDSGWWKARSAWLKAR